MRWYFYIPIGLAVLFLIVLSLVYLAARKVFHHRYDGKPNLRYLTADVFPGLLTEKVAFPGNRKQTLRGFLYYRKRKESAKALIVFCHGIGAGHQAYTTEIDSFTKQGYLVLAFDYTGCALSGGTSIRGLTQAVIDLDYALKYVERRPDLAMMKRILVGHSWGGYVVNNVFSLRHTVSAIVSIAGFNSASEVVTDLIKMPFFRPWFFLVNYLTFGRYATYTSLRSLKKSQVPTLLIQSRCDQMVKYAHALSRYIRATKGRGNFTYIIEEEKMHNPYLSLRGEQYLINTMSKIAYIDKKATDKEKQAFYAGLDYDLLTEEDPVFMQKIFDWLVDI